MKRVRVYLPGGSTHQLSVKSNESFISSTCSHMRQVGWRANAQDGVGVHPCVAASAYESDVDPSSFSHVNFKDGDDVCKSEKKQATSTLPTSSGQGGCQR